MNKEQKWFHFLGKRPSPAFLASLISVLLLGYALLLSPAIGMADSGDFGRVANPQGIYTQQLEESDRYFNYFIREYGNYMYYNETGNGIFTSQIPMIGLAKGLNSLLNPNPATFDIRYLGAIHIAYFALAVYFLTEYVTCGRKRGWASYLIAALTVFMFADLAYTAYFNSFYAEGMVFISFILCVSSALLMTKNRYPQGFLLGMIFVNGLILTCAKQQNAPEGFLLGFLCMTLPYVIKREEHRFPKPDALKTERKNWFSAKKWKAVSCTAGAVLCVAGLMVYTLIPKTFVNINQYHAMTRGILMTSPNPEKTLDTFEIDRQYALLDQTIYFERFPAAPVESQMLEDAFYSKYGFGSMLAYYTLHPGQLMQMMNLAAKNAYSIRPAYVGNYEKSVEHGPGDKTQFFTLYSSFKENAAPKTFGFIVLWSVLALVLSRKQKGRTLVLLFCILSGVSQMGISILGAGDADLSKHVFIFNVAFDVVNYIGFASLIWMWSDRIEKKRMKKQTKPMITIEKEQVTVNV